MNLYEELDKILASICIDEDWVFILGSAGWKITIENEYEDSNSYSKDIYWSTSFKAEKDKEIFNCNISGEAEKKFYYDRWVDTNCYVIEDYNIEKK